MRKRLENLPNRVFHPISRVAYRVLSVVTAIAAIVTGSGLFAASHDANPVPAIGQNARDVRGSSQAGRPRILLLGNSITRHGPQPSIGWTNDCGKAEFPAAGIVSPDGKVGVAFTAADGQPKVAVSYEAKNIATIDLGLVLKEPYQGGFEIEDFEMDGADTSWKPVWGEQAEIRDAHRDYAVRLREKGPKARALRIEMRAYPEGFAFRYVLEGQGREKVLDELTRVVFAPGTVAWPIYNTEDTYPAEPVDAANLLPAPGTQYLDHYMLPLTVRRPDGVCASLFEAYVRHYPRAKGEAVRGGTKIRLIGDLEGRTRGTADVALPFEGPWRAIQIGKDAAQLVENATLVLNLNPPCAIKDTSYIRPGLCLSDLENCAMNNRDILAAATRERANGIRHFQIDWGWCGTEWTWSAEEIAAYEKGVPDADKRFPGWRKNIVADPRRPAKGYVPYRPNGFFDYGTTVDLDLPELVKDLSAIGVDLALYMHGRVFEAEKDLDGLFALYRQWGLAGLKPGFVRYGDAESTDWNRMLVETAARHNLWLDIHDRHVPDGMQRTYPNLMLCEGGGGEEGNHPVRQDVSLPFARCLVGPFDYTPKLFREDRTHAHSAAMLLVYPGPSAILRGSAVKREWGPELDFVKRLPMTYDETKVLAADIGKHLIVARRKGDLWYVAGICGEAGYDAGFMLDFLGRDGAWTADLCADGAGGRAVASVRQVSGGGWFPVRMGKGGGFTLVFSRAVVTAVGAIVTGSGLFAASHDANPVPAIGQNARDVRGSSQAGRPRILLLGNSITRHGPRPSIGWTNDCGMAASSAEKDYAHVLAAKVKAEFPTASFALANVAATFERKFQKGLDLEADFGWMRDWRPDAVVMFFGANCPTNYDPKADGSFGRAVDELRGFLANGGKTRFLISEGFYRRPALDAEKRAVAERHGDVFVPMADIRTREGVHGRFNHPSDEGMRLIAERFWNRLEPVISKLTGR